MQENAKLEILEAINLLAEQMQDFRDEFGDFKKKTEANFVAVNSELGNMKSEVGSIKSQMVTKSYLDDKLADLRNDLVALMRKSDVKLSVLIESLVKEGSLKKKTGDLILAMEPFASS